MSRDSGRSGNRQRRMGSLLARPDRRSVDRDRGLQQMLDEDIRAGLVDKSFTLDRVINDRILKIAQQELRAEGRLSDRWRRVGSGTENSLHQVSVERDGATECWNIGWEVKNLGSEAVNIVSLRLPHGQFKSDELRFTPPLELAGGGSEQFQTSGAL